MPQIPTLTRSFQDRARGTAPSLAAATAVSRAVGQVAGQVGQAANQFIKQQKDADDAAFLTESTNGLLRGETERLADIETRGADVDLETLQSDYQSRVNDIADTAPSDEARQEFLSQADNAFSRKFFPGYTRHQSNLNVQRRVNSAQSGLDDIQSEVLAGRTSVPEAVARAEAAIVGLEETAGGVVDIDKLRTSTFNQIVSSSLGGRIKSGDSVSVISEIKDGKWDQLTDANTLGRIMSAAELDIKQRGAAQKKQFASELDDYVAFLSSGKDSEDLSEKFSPTNVSAVFGEQGGAINEQIKDARDFGNTLNEIKTASTKELAAIVERETPEGQEEFRRESRQLAILDGAIKVRNKAIAEDPSKYVINNSDLAKDSFKSLTNALQSGDQAAINQAAQEFSAIQRTSQEDLGVKPAGVQLLPKELENNFASVLNDFSQGGKNVVLQIDSMKTAFGSEWTAVQRQLQSNIKMGAGLRVLAGMDFGPEAVRLSEALSLPQKTYKEVIGDDNFKDIKADTIEELEDFQSTLRGQPGAEAAFIQHKTAIETLSMKYMADGVFDDTGDAINQAKADVLDSRFTFKDTYRVPAKVNADNVELGIDNALDRIKAGEFNLRVPESSQVVNPEDREEVYLSALRPTPITSPDGDGILFVDQNGNAIFDTNNNPFIIPWAELAVDQPSGFDIFQSGSVGQ